MSSHSSRSHLIIQPRSSRSTASVTDFDIERRADAPGHRNDGIREQRQPLRQLAVGNIHDADVRRSSRPLSRTLPTTPITWRGASSNCGPKPFPIVTVWPTGFSFRPVFLRHELVDQNHMCRVEEVAVIKDAAA